MNIGTWALPLVLAGLVTACGGGDTRDPGTAPSMELQLKFTDDLNLARQVVEQGREPIFDMSALLLEKGHKRLRQDARARLAHAIEQYPDVLLRPGLLVEVLDEVFMTTDGQVSGPDQQLSDARHAVEAIDLLRAHLPQARLGIVLAPEAWTGDAGIIALFDSLLPRLDWTATDPYFWTMDAERAAAKLRAARDFADHVATVAPTLQRWVAVQGFAPVDLGPDPQAWSAADVAAFGALLDQLFGIAATRYDGVVVWGWNLPEGSTLTPYRVFPEGLKQVYGKGLKLQCRSGTSSTAAPPTLPFRPCAP